MDATAVLSSSAWIFAEMVRYSQKSSELTYAKAIVDGLIRKQFPFFEDIDGRLYTDIGESAFEIAVLLLARIYPNRMSRAELIASIKRHGHSASNAAVGVSRVLKYADEDDNGNLRLRSNGLRKAEQLIAAASRES